MNHPAKSSFMPGAGTRGSTELLEDSSSAPTHLNDAVLGGQPCRLRWRVRVHGTHVLPWARLVAVQVEAIAVGTLLHVAQPRPQLLLQRQRKPVRKLLPDPSNTQAQHQISAWVAGTSSSSGHLQPDTLSRDTEVPKHLMRPGST